MIINRSESISLVPIESIKPRPDNRNKHSEEQIERLCKIIQYQGFRDPLIVSNQSGLLVSGHGRLMAAQKLGMTHIPVVYQDFESEAQEYAAMVSENSIASWAELDLSGINADLGDLGPDFDIDLLGIEDFKIDVAENEEPEVDADIEFSSELNEKNDYLVFIFADKESFSAACDKFGVQQVQINASASLHDSFKITGLGRILPGSKIL